MSISKSITQKSEYSYELEKVLLVTNSNGDEYKIEAWKSADKLHYSVRVYEEKDVLFDGVVGHVWVKISTPHSSKMENVNDALREAVDFLMG